MQLKRVREAIALPRFRLRLILTDGSRVERDISDILEGPMFRPLREDEALFRQVRVEGGTVTWPNGADICPDVLIWGGAPPVEEREAPRSLRIGRMPTVA